MFGSDSFCGVCRTELVYNLWQVFAFLALNVIIPVAIMSVMYIYSIRTISRKASKCTFNDY